MARDFVLMRVADVRALDAESVRCGVSLETLMANAGAAVATAIRRRFSPRPTIVLCGPGANGGDGQAAARRLIEAGWPVRTVLLDQSAPAPSLEDAEIVIDALFGAGLSRPLDGAAADLALASNRRFVVAVDVPSGVPGDGAPPSGPTFRADLTVTFERKKPAHVLEPGRSLCGEIVVAPIGAPAAALSSLDHSLRENARSLWAWPEPGPASYKHRRGHALVVSGPFGRTGAARLAARAALRVGAGLVTVASAPSAMLENAAHATAVMIARCDDAEALADMARDVSVVIIGPGLGVDARARAAVEALLKTRTPLVLDADVFTLFRDDPEALFAGLSKDHALTPHAGEFARLFGPPPTSCSKIDVALVAAKRAGAVVLYKGADTVIASPDGRAVVNTTSSPHLATAGSGDVLAGAIGGLIAQGMPIFDAASAGAWLHGRAGLLLGRGLIAEDLADALPRALRIR